MTRAVFVLPYLADYRSAFFDELAERLDDDLVILHPARPLDPTIRVTSHRLSSYTRPVRKILVGFESQPHLVRDVATAHPHVVIAEAGVRDLSYLRLLAWCRINRIPVAVWGLGRYNRPRSRLESVVGNLMSLALVTLSNAVIGKGAGPANYYRRFTCNKGKVSHAPNSSGLESSLLNIRRPRRVPISAGSPLRILFVGRITPAKDIDLLLQALVRLDAAVHWRLDLVGEGPSTEELRAAAAETEFSSRVVFHGNMSGDSLRERFVDADCLVLPGKGGLVIPESLAAGLPVLSGPFDHSGDGTLGELLTDGENAIAAESSDLDGWVRALERLVQTVQSGGLDEMHRDARQSFEKHGGVTAMAQKFIAFIDGRS